MTLPPAAGLLVPTGAVVAWPSEHTDGVRVRRAPAGTVVALADRRPGGRRRLRRAAARLGVRIDAEFVVLPSWRLASFVMSDDVVPLAWLVETFLAPPPGVALGHSAVHGMSRLARRAIAHPGGAAAVRLLVAAAVPGRLVIGTRT